MIYKEKSMIKNEALYAEVWREKLNQNTTRRAALMGRKHFDAPRDNSQGKITPFNKSDIPTGITFHGVRIVRQKFQLTVLYPSRLYLISRLQYSQGKITPFN